MRLLVLPILAPALLEGDGLALLRDAGDEVCVAGCDAFLEKRLRNLGNELQERQTRIDMACALAGLLDQSGNVVAGNIEQTLKPLRLFEGVNVHALGIFNLS